MNIIFFWKWDI